MVRWFRRINNTLDSTKITLVREMQQKKCLKIHRSRRRWSKKLLIAEAGGRVGRVQIVSDGRDG